MTLEHIIDTGAFIRSVRGAIGDRLDTTVCFQIPNGRYVFGDLAFWDVYARPPEKPRYTRGVVETWWLDADKAEKLGKGA